MKDIKLKQQQKLWYLQIADLHTFMELNISWLDILRPTWPHSWRKKKKYSEVFPGFHFVKRGAILKIL